MPYSKTLGAVIRNLIQLVLFNGSLLSRVRALSVEGNEYIRSIEVLTSAFWPTNLGEMYLWSRANERISKNLFIQCLSPIYDTEPVQFWPYSGGRIDLSICVYHLCDFYASIDSIL